MRASPAGRAILANGPGAYGLTSAADGLAWLTAYRGFLAAPTTPPPGGDTTVPVGGDIGLTLPRGATLVPGSPLTLTFSRGGRAIVRLIDARGVRRVIAARTIPASGGTLRATIPRLLKPGRHRLAVTIVGDGLTDSLERVLWIGRAPVTARLRARSTAAGWALLVRPSAAARLTGRLEISTGRTRYALVRALPARRLAKGREATIALGDLEPGRYRAVVRLNGGAPITRGFQVTS